MPAMLPPRAGSPLRILIADDNRDAADLLADVVTSHGHVVAVAYDGPSALAMAEDFAPQVALLDIGLPIMDGLELARRMRLLPRCVDTLLIAVSGYSQPEHRERSERAGFSHHLVKPVGMNTLLALLPVPLRVA